MIGPITELYSLDGLCTLALYQAAKKSNSSGFETPVLLIRVRGVPFLYKTDCSIKDMRVAYHKPDLH